MESLGRRVRPAGTRRRRGGFGHEFSEGRCAGEATRTAGGLDGVDDPVPARLLAEITNGLLQLTPVSTFKKLRRRAAPTRVHTHVVRGIEAERETASSVVQLMRRHPNVHQHSSKTTLNAVKVTEIFGVETQPGAILGQQGRGAFARLGIAVECHHGSAGRAV